MLHCVLSQNAEVYFFHSTLEGKTADLQRIKRMYRLMSRKNAVLEWVLTGYYFTRDLPAHLVLKKKTQI